MKIAGRKSAGFTLIELLVAIVVIAILCALGFGVAQSAMANGRKIAEINAAKNLLTAYLVATSDQGGQYLPGYDRTVGSIPGPGGVLLSGPAAERYPWRLAPYLSNDLNGSILVGSNAKQIDPSDTYMVSCYPAFGINYIFLGGDIQSNGTMTYPGDCITRTADTASIVAFASACGSGTSSPGGNSATTINGYCILTPPNLTGPMWNNARWSRNSSPSDYGNVDGRYNGKAVCAFLDGSVRMESIEELRDMRLWSRSAAQTGNANYTVADTTQRGGRLK